MGIKIGGRTMVLSPTNGDMSQTTVTAGPFDIRESVSATIQAVFTGSPVGSLQLYGCIGNPTQPSQGPDGTSWAGWTFTAMGSAVAVSGAGSTLWDLTGSGISAVQVVYTKSSGTGTLACFANTKG